MAVPARGEDGVGALVEVEGAGRGREAEGGGRQVRRHEEHERRHSAGRRRRVRRGDDSIDSAHHKTHRPSTIRGKCRQLVPSPRWMIGRQGSRGQCPSEVGLLLLSGSLFLDDREAIE